MVLSTGETWLFDGTNWNNYGTWRPGDFSMGIDVDQAGNVWVCGLEGAAKRDVAFVDAPMETAAIDGSALDTIAPSDGQSSGPSNGPSSSQDSFGGTR